MNHRAAIALVASFVAIATAASAQDVITVNVSSVVSDVSRKPIGINVNFLLDDDENRPAAIEDLAQALRKAGVKYLRYPGGEKSDAYLWSVPPYNQSLPTLARWAVGDYPQNQEWPSYDRHLVESDGRTFKTAPLDFDEFMTLCRAIDCVPTIVVCYDSMYKPAQTGGVAPTRQQLLETAREWVRYANVTKRYGIRYWEIGNESYLQHYNGSATAANYARDLIEFSRVMKGVDPTIRIGANGESESWWRTILSTASAAIDFLAVHNYPATNWGSYSYYQNTNVNLLPNVQIAENAINLYAPAADRSRLVVASTEINAADWSGGWPNVNDLGHALALFDIFGAHLARPRVEYTQLWNTRWSGNETATTPSLWDALDKNNQLQATGLATAIWGQFLKDQLVATTSTARVRTYASYSPSSGRTSVFLINKDTAARAVSVTLSGLAGNFVVDTWMLTGTGAADLAPKLEHLGQRWNGGNVFALTLPAVSITVLDIAADARVHQVPAVVQAEDFRDGAYFDTTPGNTGGVYRTTDVDIQATTDQGGGFNVGWIGAGEWLEYAIQVPSGGRFDLALRVASPYTGSSLRVLVDGKDVSGSMSVPNTGGWQRWQTIARGGIDLAAGSHRVRIHAVTSGFNLNWFSLAASVTTAPITIQAEDFRDGGFWDSTAGNYGGVYRSTDVDIQATSDAGGGFNVGWFAAGEWLEYDVYVPSAGSYDVLVRTATPNAGKTINAWLDTAAVAAGVPVPTTGSHQKWQTVTAGRVFLTAGTHRIRIGSATGGFNLNWIQLAASGS